MSENIKWSKANMSSSCRWVGWKQDKVIIDVTPLLAALLWGFGELPETTNPYLSFSREFDRLTLMYVRRIHLYYVRNKSDIAT